MMAVMSWIEVRSMLLRGEGAAVAPPSRMKLESTNKLVLVIYVDTVSMPSSTPKLELCLILYHYTSPVNCEVSRVEKNAQ